MVLLERICSNITTLILSLVIISLILITCLFDQAVLMLGEIGCRSLSGLKGLLRELPNRNGNKIRFHNQNAAEKTYFVLPVPRYMSQGYMGEH